MELEGRNKKEASFAKTTATAYGVYVPFFVNLYRDVETPIFTVGITFIYSSTMFKPEAEQYFHVLELVWNLSKDRLCFGITFLKAETQINSRCMERVLYCMAPSGVN